MSSSTSPGANRGKDQEHLGHGQGAGQGHGASQGGGADVPEQVLTAPFGVAGCIFGYFWRFLLFGYNFGIYGYSFTFFADVRVQVPWQDGQEWGDQDLRELDQGGRHRREPPDHCYFHFF